MNIIAAVSFAVFTDDADTTLYCANRTNDILGHISNLVPVLSVFSLGRICVCFLGDRNGTCCLVLEYCFRVWNRYIRSVPNVW